MAQGYPSSSNTAEFPVTGSVDCALANIIDQTTSSTYTYICEAIPGTASFLPLWRISRLTVATGVIQWASGNGNFDKIADNRALLTYL